MLSRPGALHMQLGVHSTSPMKTQAMSRRVCLMVDDYLSQYSAQDSLLKLYRRFRMIP